MAVSPIQVSLYGGQYKMTALIRTVILVFPKLILNGHTSSLCLKGEPPFIQYKQGMALIDVWQIKIP